MIYEALICFSDELNEFFRSKLKISEDKAFVSSIVNPDGSIAVTGENKILITLINLERELSAKGANAGSNSRGFSSVSTPSSLTISLQVLCSAYFTGNNYTEGLKFLAMVISFLQQKPVFTLSNTPRLHQGIDKLMFDMETVGLEKLNNIWAMLGAKYMPSALYKIRMLVFESGAPVEYRPVINESTDKPRVAD